jgi:hypothetical protein
MSGEDIDLAELLGPLPETENLVDAAPPKSRPMGKASRALLERSRSYPVNGAIRAKKNTPERLMLLLRNASEMPVGADAARRAGISFTTLQYWLQKSKEGAPGDGFDCAIGAADENGTENNTIRFHTAWDSALITGLDRVAATVHMRAEGYRKPQVYKGRVQYQFDPAKVSTYIELGLPLDDRDPRLWLRDKSGAPVPESVLEQDPELAMFLLKTKHPDYKPKAIDVNVRGGVLVVGMRAATSEALNEIEEKYRKEGLPAVTFEEDDDDGVA